jgi:hypothetical protein
VTTSELHSWVTNGPLDLIPVMADAAEEIEQGDPETPPRPGLATGLRVCQVEGLYPAELLRFTYPGGGWSLYTPEEAESTVMTREFMENSGMVERYWGWKVDGSWTLTRHKAHYVGKVRGCSLHGINSGPSAEVWRAFATRVIAIAALGRVSAAFQWHRGPLTVARSAFSNSFNNPVVYHAVRKPADCSSVDNANTLSGSPPAVCGRNLSWLSRWESYAGTEVDCDRCLRRLRRMITAYDVAQSQSRRARSGV